MQKNIKSIKNTKNIRNWCAFHQTKSPSFIVLFSLSLLLLLAIAVFAVIASGCVGLEELGEGGEGGEENVAASLYGIVTDLNKVPLEGAHVLIISDALNYSDLTDENGRFNITGIQPGTYTLIIMKEGYRNATVPFTFVRGGSYPWNVTLYSSKSSLYGTITNAKKVPLEGVLVSIIGDSQNYSGKTDMSGEFNITGIQPGTYKLVVEKAGYRAVILSNFTFLEGHKNSWNVTLWRDCLYYPVNVSTNYVVRYGWTGTLYRGEVTCTLPYPEGATYSVFPEEDGISDISTSQKAGNRMLRWKLDNTAGRYSYVEGHIYIDLKGNKTMELFESGGMHISEAASRQPGYLGKEVASDGRTMINPTNSQIKEIAQKVKEETGSDDVWTVAKALFIWLKNNTEYYHGPESDVKTQSATEVLQSRKGDCDELSYLYISLLRAVGIPARFIEGYYVTPTTGGIGTEKYVGHVWIEFYDGEWIPVEVATTENQTYENGIIRGKSGNITRLADTRFGIALPDHIAIFVDDGTSESVTGEGCRWTYYNQPPSFEAYKYYDAINYGEMFLAVCADGTRELVKEKE